MLDSEKRFVAGDEAPVYGSTARWAASGRLQVFAAGHGVRRGAGTRDCEARLGWLLGGASADSSLGLAKLASLPFAALDPMQSARLVGGHFHIELIRKRCNVCHVTGAPRLSMSEAFATRCGAASSTTSGISSLFGAVLALPLRLTAVKSQALNKEDK